jgi:hypothetical protein
MGVSGAWKCSSIDVTSWLEAGKWSVSGTNGVTSGKRFFAIHWVGGWVGCRVGMDGLGIRKNLLHLQGKEKLVYHQVRI